MSDPLLESLLGKKQTISDKRTGGKNAYKFKQKSTTIRLLPSWRAARSDEAIAPWYHDFGQAFIKDLDGNLLAVVGDRKMSYGEDDPIRNLLNLAMAEAGSDAERGHYKGLLAKQRHIVNALVLNDKDVDNETPEIIEFSQTQLETIIDKMITIARDGENVFDFDKGYNLVIGKEGTGILTRYTFDFERRPSAINSSVMEKVVDLDAFVRAKFIDTDKAIAAIKSVSQSAALALPSPSKTVSYSDSSIVEADYTVIDAAKEIREPNPTTSISDKTIDELLADMN